MTTNTEVVGYDVYGFRPAPLKGRRGYFRIKFYVGNADFFDVDSFKLMATDSERFDGWDGHYILPPAEKPESHDGKWRDYCSMSRELKIAITKKAVLLYKSIPNGTS